MINSACPLCQHKNAALFLHERERDFYTCQNCELIFVPPEFFITHIDEKKRYDLHQNSSKDQGYRDFLNRLLQPLCDRVKPKGKGLDFGSGPGPTLSVMLQEAGHAMTIYDPYYAPNEEALSSHYDFITATEVIEHLREPREVLDRLWTCLKVGGVLGVMTQLVPEDKTQFAMWYYKKDPTHIMFYSPATFKWLAAHWQAECELISQNVMLILKSAT